MGTNGVFGYGDYSANSQYYLNYLDQASSWFTRSLAWCPGNIWSARNATQAWNSATHLASQPYGFYYNFTGTPRYVVASQYEMPYQVAASLHGYKLETQVNPEEVGLSIMHNTLLQTVPGMVNAKLQGLKGIGQWKDAEVLADYPELKEEAKELEKEIDKQIKKLEIVMKNEAGLDPAAVLDSVNEIAALLNDKKDASGKVTEKGLRSRVQELYEKCAKADAEYKAKKKEEADAAADAAATQEGGDTAGETTVTTTEGDKKMDTDALATEYGVKKPVIASDQEVSTIVRNVKINTNNSDDKKNHTDFVNMFDTGTINKGNIIEVLDGVLSSNYDLYDGIYEMDKSNDAMGKVIATIRERVNELTPEYLDRNTAKTIKDALALVENKLGTGTDIPSSSPKFSWGDKKNLDVNGIFKEIVAKLKGKGTQADFDAKVKAKQNERTTKATADFYKDHATPTGKQVNGTPALPAGVTYLPNSKEFQWKYDSSTVFKGKSYKELNDKILSSKNREVIAKWDGIVKEMDKHLKAKAQ